MIWILARRAETRCDLDHNGPSLLPARDGSWTVRSQSIGGVDLRD